MFFYNAYNIRFVPAEYLIWLRAWLYPEQTALKLPLGFRRLCAYKSQTTNSNNKLLLGIPDIRRNIQSKKRYFYTILKSFFYSCTISYMFFLQYDYYCGLTTTIPRKSYFPTKKNVQLQASDSRTSRGLTFRDPVVFLRMDIFPPFAHRTHTM